MVNPKVDEQSMMTYLSQFPNARLNSDAPIKPRTNAARVRAYGPGTPSAHAREFIYTFYVSYYRLVSLVSAVTSLVLSTVPSTLSNPTIPV